MGMLRTSAIFCALIMATMLLQPVNAAEVQKGAGAFTALGSTGDLGGQTCTANELDPPINDDYLNWSAPGQPGWKFNGTVVVEGTEVNPTADIRACGYIGTDMFGQDTCRLGQHNQGFRTYGGYGQLEMRGQVIKFRDIEWSVPHSSQGLATTWTATTLDSSGNPAGVIGGQLSMGFSLGYFCQGRHNFAGTFTVAGCSVQGVRCKP